MNVHLAIAMLAILAATDPPVETTKKNIQVLQGLPSSQLIPVMAFMSNSLGVTCAHCHTTNAFESDEKPAKQTARKMIAMQRAINTQHFDGKLTVTCNSCHRGNVKPDATPEVENAGWNRVAPPAVDPTIAGEERVKRLTAAKVARRVVKGTVERFNGRDAPVSEPFTLTITGPDPAKDLQYDTKLSHPPEAVRALLLYLLAPPPAQLVAGERWLFDAKNGMLVRRTRELATPLGMLPEQIEFDDFRGGLPYLARWSRADYRVTYRVTEVE
jgi:hypothetical protein